MPRGYVRKSRTFVREDCGAALFRYAVYYSSYRMVKTHNFPTNIPIPFIHAYKIALFADNRISFFLTFGRKVYIFLDITE